MYPAADILRLIGKARKAGLVPVCLLFDDAFLVESKSSAEGFVAERMSAGDVFGIPARVSDGFAVLCEECLSVWNEEEE